LFGLLVTKYLGWQWADRVAALGMRYWIVGKGCLDQNPKHHKMIEAQHRIAPDVHLKIDR
jgi:hypothetical protein